MGVTPAIGAGLRVDDRPAIRDRTSVVSGAALDRLAGGVAHAVAAAVDHRAGRDVALLGEWTAPTLGAVVGLARAGWTVGVLDPVWTDAELRGALAQFAPVAIVVSDDRAGATALDGWRETARTDAGLRIIVRGDAGEAGAAPPPPRPDDPFYVGFTSGSSGRPKAFARSHGSWIRSFAALDAAAPVPRDALVLVPGPLSSSHFLFGALHALHAGACVELRGEPVTCGEGLADRLRREPLPQAMYVVPTMLARLVAASEPLTAPITVYCAGAKLSEALRAELAERHPGIRVVEYYGASELSFVAIRTPDDGSPAGSVGRAVAGVEIAIQDERGTAVAIGTPGQIFVRSDLVFDGYRGEVPGSAATCRDGWWSVGDTGVMDDAGNLFVAGRGSSLIITGGANVQPEEVEETLAAVPGVRVCAVVGVPHAVLGQEVVAVLELHDRTLRRADLRRLLSTGLAAVKRPRRYLVAGGPLPLGRTGKVDRDAVAALVAAGAMAELR